MRSAVSELNVTKISLMGQRRICFDLVHLHRTCARAPEHRYLPNKRDITALGSRKKSGGLTGHRCLSYAIFCADFFNPANTTLSA